MNNIAITGNVVDKPELVHYAAGGNGEQRSLAKFRVASTEGRGTDREHTDFMDVVAFGPQAEHLARSINKGDRVVVMGVLNQRSWEREDGTRGYRLQINAQAVGASLEFHEVSINRKTTAGTEMAAAAAGGAGK